VSDKKDIDLALLGATGFTGRQLVRALRRQAAGSGLRVLLAGRRADLLSELAGSDLETQVCDIDDAPGLRRLAGRSRVLLNLAGPYAERGEPVIQACLLGRCHHLDLSGEVFWMRQMLQRHHAEAIRRGVMLVGACGYEALPFDLATQAVAQALLERYGQRCAAVDVALRFTGHGIHRLSDAVSGGTLASMRAVLEHDRSDSLQRMDCLLPDPPPPGWNANAVALNNAAPLSPWWDAERASVMAPALPAPFINPPLVLRSAALAPERFAPGFRYREGLSLREDVEALLQPLAAALPGFAWAQAGLGGTSLAAQWSAAATLAAPLAALSAAAGSGGTLARQALARLIELVGPKPGSGPRESQLDAMGYELHLRARGEGDARLHARMRAAGHPGYRSTPEMMAAVGLALAAGRLGQGRSGWLSPGAAFGPEGLDELAQAGVTWELHEHEAV